MHSNCPTCKKEFELADIPEGLSEFEHQAMFNLSKIVKCTDCAGPGLSIHAGDSELFARRLDLSLIPKEYIEWDKGKGNIPMMKWVLKNKTESLFIADTYGTNKTRIVCAIAASMVKLVDVRYYRTTDLMRQFSELFGTNMTEVRLLEHRLKSVYLLILDDFGKEKLTQRVGEMIYSIIDDRYRQGKSLWITTNFSGDDLLEHLGDNYGGAIIRRLSEMCLDWFTEKKIVQVEMSDPNGTPF